jgi:cytochrome c oxidase assembly factor CtaG
MPLDLLELCLASLPPVRPEAWLARWSLAPEIVLPLALTLGLWLRGARRVGVGGWRAAAFLLGWAALVVALVSPLCRMAATLAWAHMVQHALLVAVAPPLLLLGEGGALRASLPARLRPGPAPAALRRLAAPGWSALLYGFAIWFWHVPLFYEAALRSEWVHLAQIGSLLGLGLLFWSASVTTPIRDPEAHGASILTTFATAMHTGLLGALLTFAARPWYPLLSTNAPAWGLSPLEDQQLAGLIMWAPMSAVYLVAGLALMAVWLPGLERRAG